MKNDKRNISCQKKEVQKKYKGIRIKERIMSLVLAASMGIGVTVAPMEKFLSDNVTIAKTTDNTEDNNYGGIPLYLEDMEQILVPNDSIVIVDDKIEEESEDMVSIVAISEKGEQVYGKTYSQYLNMLEKISKDELRKYNTVYTVTADESIGIQSSISANGTEIGKIVPDEQVLGRKKNIVSDKNELWKPILYVNDKEIKKGYVPAEQLKEISINKTTNKEYIKKEKQNDIENNSKSKEYEESNSSVNITSKEKSPFVQKILDNRTISKSGNVVGIDISNWVSPEELRKLLTKDNIISSSTNAETFPGSGVFVSTNTENIAGKINFVYIKIGASKYGKEHEFEIAESAIYKEQAKVCEELGIPYGFYYYSTAINKEEAKKEGEYIVNSIKKLDTNKSKYNLLPVALDVELAGVEDRQYGKDVSETKAIVSNMVSKEYGPTILYSGKRILDSGEKILDYDKYTSMLENDSLGIWLVSPRNTDGTYRKESVKYAEKNKSNTMAYQDLLDVRLDGIGVDIDIMQPDIFDHLVQREYSQIKSYNKHKNTKINSSSTFKNKLSSDKMVDYER